jgi:hypothetical protein
MLHVHDHPSPHPPQAIPSASRHRHAQHRAVDGDWPTGPRPVAADRRRTLAMGLAALATLPAVSLLLARWPDASPALVGTIGTLPLAALLVVALAWRTVGGES